MALLDGHQSSTHWRVNDDDASAFSPTSTSPTRKVALAIGLLIIGMVLLFTGVGLYVSSKPGGVPLLIIGSLAFIPGAYHTRIAYNAYRGVKGFSLTAIPDV
ncbi:UPF0414 transmembrane protein-like protein C20orf30 [Haematococcus lacustris]